VKGITTNPQRRRNNRRLDHQPLGSLSRAAQIDALSVASAVPCFRRLATYFRRPSGCSAHAQDRGAASTTESSFLSILFLSSHSITTVALYSSSFIPHSFSLNCLSLHQLGVALCSNYRIATYYPLIPTFLSRS